MRLLLIHREKLQALGSYLVSELDSLVARIRTGWAIEHTEDGSHTEVHAETVTTGRLVFSDIVEAPLLSPVTHNWDPGIETASVLRVLPDINGTMITGLRVPQDAAGNVLDGRVLILEVLAVNGRHIKIAGENSPEGQGSFPRNRIRIPWQPSATNAVTECVVNPSSFITLMYNAKIARWVIGEQRYDNSSAFQAFSSSQNDFAFGTSPRAMRIWRLIPEAPDLSVSGFARDQLPEDEKKTVVNEGQYVVALLHASALSLAAHRIYCPGGVRYLLHPRESVEIQCIRGEAGGWRVLAKAAQWIDVPFATTNFIAPGATWGVTAADVGTFCYRIDGNSMTVAFQLNETSLNTAAPVLALRIPDGRLPARQMRNALAQALDNAVLPATTGFIRVLPGDSLLYLYRDMFSANWTASTDLTFVAGEITFMIYDDPVGIVESHTDVLHQDASHSDAEHQDVTHVDVAHVDSHGDSAHSDVGHTDTLHTDSHTDTHSDTAHSDVPHSDASHADAHTDTAHQDVPGGPGEHQDQHWDTHGDTPHVDVPFDDVPFVNSHTDQSHADAHDDIEHTDTHSDFPHTDEHEDGFHEDFDLPGHIDLHGDEAHDDVHQDASHVDWHGDIAHDDQHTDQSHGDQGHTDVTHQDAAHEDAHVDFASPPVPHTDVAHTDTHGDSVHGDSHGDVTHVDTHIDSHSDAAHLDTGHTDLAHADSHTDSPHSDTSHTDQAHGDAAHGDTSHQDQGFHTDISHADI